MVLLAAAVCTKSGKALVSRQFIEMERARIEGLLSAFPGLMSSDNSKGAKQHTFVETDSVRYVYQPLEKMYMLLITTKNSNILEDLETLRLFSRVIPEYCRKTTIDEQEVANHSFDLIFAFDEIVALGYRESVNLAQIRTFTEMDSHEEKVWIAMRETQMKEAKQQMKEKAKELAKARSATGKSRLGGAMAAIGGGGSVLGGMSSASGSTSSGALPTADPIEKPKPKRIAKGGGMKLGGKKTGVDSFVDKLESEGVHVSSNASKSIKEPAKAVTPSVLTESIHIRIEEKVSLTANRDGGCDDFTLTGMMMLKITDEETSKIKVKLNKDDERAMWQTHPQVDKKKFNSENVIGLKNADRPFPVNQDVGVLKWRMVTQDEDQMPLAITCWPNETGDGNCDVSVEYELQQDHLELADVSIRIPIPSGVGAPVVGSCDGDYNHDSRKNILEWNLPVIDSSNGNGSMEFSIAGNPDDFFPVNIDFHSTKKSFINISIAGVVDSESNSPVKYSSESALLVDKYEIV